MKVTFKKTTQFLGRNGGFKCTGVEFYKTVAGTILIEPITSKGEIGRCFIEVPAENIQEFIEALKKTNQK